MPTINMTANWVKAAQPPESGRVTYSDEKEKGLGLRVSWTGTKVWCVLYRVKGDRTRRGMTLDPYPQMTLADAREKVKEVKLAARRGQDPAAEKQEERGAPTFEWLAREYLERWAKPKKKSWKMDVWYLETLVLPVLGKQKAHEIRRGEVRALLDKLAVDRPVLANRTLAMIKRVYNWGVEVEHIEDNPCAPLKKVAAEKSRDRVLSETEIKVVWAALERQPVASRAVFQLALLTAQRGGEVRTMRWRDVDLESAWWTIPGEVAKNERSHRVPLSEPALAILRSLRKDRLSDEWVFPSPQSTNTPITSVRHIVANVRSETGVEFQGTHDLRRTAASMLAGMGTSRFLVKKVLNHVDSEVTAVYDRHTYDREKRDALNSWAARLMQLVTPDPQ